MAETTNWGFPKGPVAETLRKILAPDLTDHEVEAIVVCLVAHLLIESRLNNLLYGWLSQDAPRPPTDDQVSRAEDNLWKNIVKIDFAKKYSLIEPFVAPNFREEAATIWKLNDLRNDLFHGRALRDAKFAGQPFSDETTVENLFLAAQTASMQLRKFEELIDRPHAVAERWRTRLEALGEPLL
jgi:hypothetical protein